MINRDRLYAAQVFAQVSQISEAERPKYGSMAHKLPLLIRTAGLAQALEFVRSRGSSEHHKLLEHLSAVVNETGLLAHSRTAELGEYMRLTRDVLAALVWYKRFAQSVLGVDAAEEADGTGNE